MISNTYTLLIKTFVVVYQIMWIDLLKELSDPIFQLRLRVKLPNHSLTFRLTSLCNFYLILQYFLDPFSIH